jgi:hypothetical protein
MDFEEEKAWEVAEKFFAKWPNIIDGFGKKITLENFKVKVKSVYEELIGK